SFENPHPPRLRVGQSPPHVGKVREKAFPGVAAGKQMAHHRLPILPVRALRPHAHALGRPFRTAPRFRSRPAARRTYSVYALCPWPYALTAPGTAAGASVGTAREGKTGCGGAPCRPVPTTGERTKNADFPASRASGSGDTPRPYALSPTSKLPGPLCPW